MPAELLLRRAALVVAAAGVLGMLVVIPVLYRRAERADAAYAASALEASNLRAARDTTRAVLVLADSSIVWQRAAVQQQQRADSVDRALRVERTALTELRATVRELRTTARSTGDVVVTRGSDSGGAPSGRDVRTGTFSVRDAPFTVNAVASLPDSGRGSLDVAVRLDPIPLTVRPACTAPDAHGIRSAVVSVQGPAWAMLQVTRAEQDPTLCRSPALESAARAVAQRQDRRARLAIVAGIGGAVLPPIVALSGGSGGMRAGLGVFVGLAVAKPVPCPRVLPGC